MDRLSERLELAAKALGTLREVAADSYDDAVRRDAAIQRFEYTFEATWKAAKLFQLEVEGVEVGSPKAAVRAAFQVGLLTEEEAERALGLVDDRNLTVHTYNEELARTLASRLPGHAELMGAWLDRMGKRRAEAPG